MPSSPERRCGCLPSKPAADRKLAIPYTGPWRVIQQLSSTLRTIRPEGSWCTQPKTITVSLNCLKHCRGDERAVQRVDFNLNQLEDADDDAEGPMTNAWTTADGSAATRAPNHEIGDVHTPSLRKRKTPTAVGESATAQRPAVHPRDFEGIAPSLVVHHEHTNVVSPSDISSAHRSFSRGYSATMTTPAASATLVHPETGPLSQTYFDRSAAVRLPSSQAGDERTLPPVSEVSPRRNPRPIVARLPISRPPRRPPAHHRHPPSYIANREEYLYFDITSQAEKEFDAILHQDCLHRQDEARKAHFFEQGLPGYQPFLLQDGVFSTRSGETNYRYQCIPRVVHPVSTSRCYNKLPVVLRLPRHLAVNTVLNFSSSTTYFLDPDSRLLSPIASEVPCSAMYPAVYRTHQGWIAVTPEIHQAPSPELLPVSSPRRTEDVFRNRDYNEGGLYQPSMLDSMQDFLLTPFLREAVIYKLAHQVYNLRPENEHVLGPLDLFPDTIAATADWRNLLFGGWWELGREVG